MNPQIFSQLIDGTYLQVLDICSQSPDLQQYCNLDYFWESKALDNLGIDKRTFNLPLGSPREKYLYFLCDIFGRSVIDDDLEEAQNAVRYGAAEVCNINNYLSIASNIGNLRMVKYLIDIGARDFNRGMASAANAGYFSIVDLFKSLGANDFSTALQQAMLGDQVDMVKYLLELGGGDINVLLTRAIDGGVAPKVVQFLLSIGAQYIPPDRMVSSGSRKRYRNEDQEEGNFNKYSHL